jgi:hypothetical protein
LRVGALNVASQHAPVPIRTRRAVTGASRPSPGIARPAPFAFTFAFARSAAPDLSWIDRTPSAAIVGSLYLKPPPTPSSTVARRTCPRRTPAARACARHAAGRSKHAERVGVGRRRVAEVAGATVAALFHFQVTRSRAGFGSSRRTSDALCADACMQPATSGTWQPRTPSQTSHGFAQEQPGARAVVVDVSSRCWSSTCVASS